VSGRDKIVKTEIQVDNNYTNMDIPVMIGGSSKKMPGTPSEK
jgi:hypothetical protein